MVKVFIGVMSHAYSFHHRTRPMIVSSCEGYDSGQCRRLRRISFAPKRDDNHTSQGAMRGDPRYLGIEVNGAIEIAEKIDI